DLEAVTHGIYLLKLDDRILVKRLQYVAEKTIRVLSDNTAYESFSLMEADKLKNVSVMGKVVWCGHRL
ncbi:transcriptional regulator, partial [filamentous cyanobacterium CCT1]